MNRTSLRKKYLDAAEKFRLFEAEEERLLLFLSILRFICFAGGLIIIWLVFLKSAFLGFILAPVLMVTFLYLLKLYTDHSNKKEFLGNLALINRNEADSMSGILSQFESGKEYIRISHDFSFDVDLFGDSSLFQYINRTVTGYGRDMLASWFSDPYPVSQELITRQEVIRELALKDEWRHKFMASGMKIPLEKSHIAGLLNWMEERTLIKSSLIKKFLNWFLPGAALISLALLIAGILHYSVFTFIFLGNLVYITTGLKRTNRIHTDLSGKYSYLSSIDILLKIFEKEPFMSKGLNDIKLNISGTGISAAVSVKRLGRLIQSFDSRMNILVGFILNGLFLWDYQCIYRLEKWKSEYREMFPVWLEMIGMVDAYISLGNFSFNNHNFVFPVKSDRKIIFSAIKVGHPLIDEAKRVSNDFSIDRSGNVCIISGANMAGKSTFLRTVSVNFILGMIGAPVCAEKMEFSPVNLFTSMRTTDSLSNNESYFYAELKRLKTLKTRIGNGEPIFFILDEILKGTNSADKSLGSKLFLKKILYLGGTGLIATHDISLGEIENDYPGSVFNMCFEIEIEGEIIKFDYRLNKGITQKMNAALLMKQMGILD
jgi:hypothetical protein